jgi:GntR family transcriptional regulator/MocR family aminotransferase
MSATGTTATGPELLVELRRDVRRPLRAQLEDGLRTAVRDGRLPAGSPLPPSRTLARDLAVSRRLVVEAYAQLGAEGYLVPRGGAGTYVAETAAAAPPVALAPEPRPPRFDLFPGAPDLTAFPRGAWTRALREALSTLPAHALGYGDPRGAPALRTALAGYLARARGVVADPERILVVSGAQQGLALLARVLARRATPRIAVEDPSLPVHRLVLERGGAELVPLAVDSDGLRVDLLAASDAAAVVVTPAHHMPTGVALSVERRAALAAWARAGGLVLEDDYDAEFRYDRPPLAALQGLAPERVAYLGSASKTLAPGLRLGWMVLPAAIADELTVEKLLDDMGTATLEQLTLARLIESGAYDRHLRVLRRRHRLRRDALVAEVAHQLPGARVTGIAAGLHATVVLPRPVDVTALEAECERRSVRVYHSQPGVLFLGYANLSEGALAQAVRRLAEAVGEAEA